MNSDVGPGLIARQDITVRIRTIDERIPLPQYASDGAAGADVYAWIPQAVTILAGERYLVPTGLYVEIPENFEIQVRSRSGLAFQHGIFVVNSPGTIDSDYRGEIKILLGNIGTGPVIIQPLDRVAQLIICPVYRARFELASDLTETNRNHGGFGSTGV